MARWGGSTHDAFIWRLSGAFDRFKEGTMPEGYLLGDGGYPLQPWLMVPFEHADTAEEIEYNERHASGWKTSTSVFIYVCNDLIIILQAVM